MKWQNLFVALLLAGLVAVSTFPNTGNAGIPCEYPVAGGGDCAGVTYQCITGCGGTHTDGSNGNATIPQMLKAGGSSAATCTSHNCVTEIGCGVVNTYDDMYCKNGICVDSDDPTYEGDCQKYMQSMGATTVADVCSAGGACDEEGG